MAELWGDKDDPEQPKGFMTNPNFAVIRIAIYTAIILAVYFLLIRPNISH